MGKVVMSQSKLYITKFYDYDSIDKDLYKYMAAKDQH